MLTNEKIPEKTAPRAAAVTSTESATDTATESVAETAAPVPLDQLARWLKVLAEPRRLAIINLLMQGVQCNCELGDALNMPANLISHHLGVLRRAGLVEMERDEQDARWIYYSISREALAEINRLFQTFFDPARIQERTPACPPDVRPISLTATPATDRLDASS